MNGCSYNIGMKIENNYLEDIKNVLKQYIEKEEPIQATNDNNELADE